MRIGLVTPADIVGQMPHAEIVRQIVQAERDGFASYWLVQLPSAGNDVLTTIALAGQQTRRIELGTSVIPVYTRHPLMLAQQAATAQAMAGGRLTLGIGLSHRPVVEQMLGLSYDRPAAYMREYLAVLRALVETGRADFQGEFLRVACGLSVPGAEPFPILLAALAPRMLALAGEQAAGTITWMAGRRTVAGHITPRIRAAAERAGRPAPRIVVALPVAVTDDRPGAMAAIGSAWRRYGELENYRRLLDLEGAAGPADVAVIGSEAEVAEQILALGAAGATDFVASIAPVGPDPAGSVARTWGCLQRLAQAG